MLSDASAEVQHLVERIEAELSFAGQLCELRPAQAKAWRPLVEKARETVALPLARRRLESVAAAVEEAEKILAPLGKTAKSYTVHCVGHAHIDMNWMWSWPETVSVTIDTFTTVLRLMDEYPAFRFSQSQASTYAILETHRPDLLERVAERVKEGRWEVTASHWVEGDKNMAGGESLCRHLLYTRQYMRKLFGLAPEDVPIDWSPDTFGHAATVPTYLVRGGIKYLYLHRPGVHTPSKPGAFWWQGPDGSRVLVRNDMELGYNGQVTPDIARHLVKFVKLTGGTEYMFVFGVGDHGGGPTRRDILRALDMDTWPVFPNVKFSTARTFYELLEQQSGRLPVLTGELNTEFTGCYTTQTLIKKDNRFAENRLVDAEAACAISAVLTGHAYPAEAFREGWRDTLFSHFHDILPGSGVHDTRTYTHGLYQKTVAMTSANETAALRALASLIDTTAAGRATLPALPPSRVASALGAGVGFRSENGNLCQSEQSAGHGPRPFVVFNPTAFDRSEVVEATIWDNSPAWSNSLRNRSFVVRLPGGTHVPAQVVGRGGYWGHDFVTLAFPAKVASLGYAQYTVVEGTAQEAATGGARLTGPRHHCGYAPYERTSEGIENDLIRLDLDTATGGIRRLAHKPSGVELIAPAQAAPALEYAVERPHGMTAWSIENTGPAEQPTVTAIRRTLDGPYKAAIEVDLRICESNLTLAYEVRANDPKLYIRIRGVWFQRGTHETGVPVLRLGLPLALSDARARYEIPFGAIDRSLNRGEEVPALQWAQVAGKAGKKPAGCLLLNDSKHGHSLDGSTLRLTLIRSSYDPDILPEIGQHDIHLALLPFVGEMAVEDAIRTGQAFNRVLRVVGTDVHDGRLPTEAHFVRVSPRSVIVSAVKRAEHEDALIVRLFNPTAKRAAAKIELNTKLFGRVLSAREVDLMERLTPNPTAKLSGSAASVVVPAHGITSVLVRLKPNSL